MDPSKRELYMERLEKCASFGENKLSKLNRRVYFIYQQTVGKHGCHLLTRYFGISFVISM